MNISLWISALLVFGIAALIPAWALFSNPQRGRLRNIENAYRDGIIKEADYREQLAQLKQDAKAGRPKMAIILLLAIPMAGLLIYDKIGTPEALLAEAIPSARTGTPGAETPGAETGMSVQDAVASLRQRLMADPDNPDNVEGWALLGNSYENLGQRVEALAAYQKAYELAPDDVDVRVEYAEAQLFADSEGRMPTLAVQLLQDVVEAHPQHAKALWLLGVAAYQERDFDRTLALWRELREYVTQPEARQSLDAQITQLEQLMNGAAATAVSTPLPTADGAQSDSASAAGTQVTVRVDMATELAQQRGAQGALFVFARSPQGGPPLASVRLSADDFPMEINLSDANAMLAGRNLSSAQSVVIGARWSNSGEALPKPGDLEGFTDPITLPTADTVAVTINSVR